jgi:hypothetical protein
MTDGTRRGSNSSGQEMRTAVRLYRHAEPLMLPDKMDIDGVESGSAEVVATTTQRSTKQQSSSAKSATDFLASEILTLAGHDSEVFTCQWHPLKPIVATGCVFVRVGASAD